MNHDFPTLEEVVAIHDIAVQEFGGAQGLRDMGALESAILRPQMGYYNGLIEESAALMESLAMNHPFVDGNKRTAFYTTDTFLRKNGHFINCDNDDAYAFFMRLFHTNTFRYAELRDWLELHIEPLRGFEI